MLAEVTWDVTPTGFGHLSGRSTTWISRSQAVAVSPRFARNPGALSLEVIDFVESDIEAGEPDAWAVHSTKTQVAPGEGSDLLREVDARLRELQAQFVDDYERELESSSRFALKVLLLSTRGLRRPLLSATPTGHLVATWRAGAASLSVRLIRATELHFAFNPAAHELLAGKPTYGRSVPASFFVEVPDALRLALAA